MGDSMEELKKKSLSDLEKIFFNSFGVSVHEAGTYPKEKLILAISSLRESRKQGKLDTKESYEMTDHSSKLEAMAAASKGGEKNNMNKKKKKKFSRPQKKGKKKKKKKKKK